MYVLKNQKKEEIQQLTGINRLPEMGCTQAKNSKAALGPKLNTLQPQEQSDLAKQTGNAIIPVEQTTPKEEKSTIQKQQEPAKHLISLRKIQTHTMKQLYLQDSSSNKQLQQKHNSIKKIANDQPIINPRSSVFIQPKSQGSLLVPGKLSLVKIQSICEFQKESIVDEKDIHFGFDEYQFQVPEIPKIKEFEYRGTMCAVYNY